MPNIKLITDSTADLSENLLKQHNIDTVPLIVNIGDESFFDGITLTTEAMYNKVEETGLMPKTAAASPGAFVEAFKPYIDEGYEVIYLGIGAKFSGTLQSAHAAKKLLDTDRITLIDSANLSSGSGLLLLKAAKFRDQGDDVKTIKEKIEALKPKVRSQFVINTLDYLHKGGRINGLQHMMGSMLRLKPIIKVRDGEMHVGKKARGSIKNGINLLIKEVRALQDTLDDDFLMITHSLAKSSHDYIDSSLRGTIPVKNIYETEAGCVISSHCGRGTIGILYIEK
jgi:DegV family protein with EDD domain